jgi:hypothetical protein
MPSFSALFLAAIDGDNHTVTPYIKLEVYRTNRQYVFPSVLDTNPTSSTLEM